MIDENAPQVEAQSTETVEQVQPVAQQETPHDSQREYNFRVMRDRTERAELRTQELERAMMQRAAPESRETELEDDGFVEGKYFKKYAKSQKETEEELEKTKKKIEQLTNTFAESYLQGRYTDFNKYVNDENIAKLEREKPALYRSIILNKELDLKDKGEAAYDAIKAHIKSDKFEDTDKKLAQNNNKPKALATLSPQVSDSSLTRLGEYDRRELTDERKAELRAEMIRFKNMR